MKRLARYATQSEAEERAAFLQSRGIPTHISDASGLRHIAPLRGNDRSILWCLLADQHEDALALLDNPEHEVGNPLTQAQMHEIETRGADRARTTILRYVLILGAFLVVAWILVITGR